MTLELGQALEAWRQREGQSGGGGRGALRDAILAIASASARLDRELSALDRPGQDELARRAQDRLAVELTDGPFAVMATPGSPAPRPLAPSAPLALAWTPLHPATALPSSAPVASLVSIHARAGDPQRSLCQAGTAQLAAAAVLYGVRTEMIVSWGEGTHIFALDRASGSFRRIAAALQVPDRTACYAIDAASCRFWDDALHVYIGECAEGAEGPRDCDCDMRWTGSPAAELARILRGGGIYLHPRAAVAGRVGGLPLVFVASPLAMLLEQAGAAASTGETRILDIVPRAIDDTVTLIAGSRHEVRHVERLYEEPWAMPQRSPLFGRRGLFRV